MAFKNSEVVGGGDYVQSSRGGDATHEHQVGASGLNVFEYLNPAAEQSSTPGAPVASVRIYDVRRAVGGAWDCHVY